MSLSKDYQPLPLSQRAWAGEGGGGGATSIAMGVLDVSDEG